MNVNFKSVSVDYYLNFEILDGDQIAWSKVTAHVSRLGADFCGAHEIKFKSSTYWNRP